MKRMRIGLIKTLPVKWAIDENIRNVERLVRLHSRDGIDVFVTPECFLDGYVAAEADWTVARFVNVAQRLEESPSIEALRRTAAIHRTHIVFGFTERIDDRFYNCALLVGREGQIIGKYHKTHRLGHDLRFSPGLDLPVFELDCGKVGILIGTDARWPEAMRVLRMKGAQVCLLPVGSMGPEDEWWIRMRACENETHVCCAYPDAPFIASPAGQIVAKMQSSPEDVLVQDVDLDHVTDMMLGDRRPELYEILSRPNPRR